MGLWGFMFLTRKGQIQGTYMTRLLGNNCYGFELSDIIESFSYMIWLSHGLNLDSNFFVLRLNYGSGFCQDISNNVRKF